jgi:hypothetical protein
MPPTSRKRRCGTPRTWRIVNYILLPIKPEDTGRWRAAERCSACSITAAAAPLPPKRACSATRSHQGRPPRRRRPRRFFTRRAAGEGERGRAGGGGDWVLSAVQLRPNVWERYRYSSVSKNGQGRSRACRGSVSSPRIDKPSTRLANRK